MAKMQQREPLETLKTYPAFQVLRAQAETHQLQFRPKESEKLEAEGRLSHVLDLRSESAWNTLVRCRKNGMNQNEAEELALPYILLPSEKEKSSEETENP